VRDLGLRTVYLMQVVLVSCGFARLHGLFGPLTGKRNFQRQVARPNVLELGALVSLAVHAGRRMDVFRTDSEPASAGTTAAASTTKQDSKRVLR
jgi:hypothetical protein